MAYLRGNRSNFPGSEDNFTELWDLTHAQVENAKRLNQLRQMASLTNAEQDEVLSLSASLRENQINPEDWNLLGDAIFNLQEFFNDEVHDYILSKQSEWDTYVQDFNHVGAWAAGKAYKAQNMVTNVRGDLFIAKQSHTSTSANQPQPENNTVFWSKIGARGIKGDPGISAKYLGDWNSARAYVLGDAVTFKNMGDIGGLVYVAKRANTNVKPNASGADWQLLTQSYIGRTEPLGAQPGTHFIHIKEV